MQRVYTYSLIKTFYDQGRDYIDAFWPLLLLVLPEDGSTGITIRDAKEQVASRFALTIPDHALGVILTRAKRQGFLEQDQQTYFLSERGRDKRTQVELEGDVQRRLNELLSDIQQYLRDERAIERTVDELTGDLQAFVGENLEFFEQFVGGASSNSLPELTGEMEVTLLDYCRRIEDSNPRLFDTLREVVLGSVVSFALFTDSFGDVGEKFGRTRVYLDTNFIFNLFGFHPDIFSEPVNELFELMNGKGVFEFRVFDFTIDEIVSVLAPYGKHAGRYLPGVPVNSIWSSLRTKGWTKARVRQFISEIEDRLSDKAIKVQPTGIDLETYVASAGDSERLAKHKPGQPTRSQIHDLAAVDQVRKLRGPSVRRLERAAHIFLTSDGGLARYNFLECHHNERGTVAEAIVDRILTTFLWLKDPGKAADIPLRSVIAMHSGELFIDRGVWNRFFETVEDLRGRGEMDAETVAVLIYDEQVQSFLKTSNVTDIDEGWVLEGVEAAKERLEEERRRHSVDEGRLRELTNELRDRAEAIRELESAFQEDTERDAERDKQILNHVQKGKRELEGEAEKRARWAVRGAILGVCVVLMLLILVWWDSLEAWEGRLALIATVLILGLGSIWDPRALRSRAEDELFQGMYKRKLRRSRLGLFEDLVTPPSPSSEPQREH